MKLKKNMLWCKGYHLCITETSSCLNQDLVLIIIRVTFGVGAQILCSYATLPLYALVTQMGSTMKRSIFDHQTSKALKNWHKKAVKKTNEGKPGQLQTRTLGSWVEVRMPLQCIPHPSHLLDLWNLVLKIQISLMLKQITWQLWISMQITNVAQVTAASHLITGIY